MEKKLLRNKRGALITGGFLMGTILIAIAFFGFLYMSTGVAGGFALNMIPAPVWILIGFILVLRLIGGKK